MWVIGFTSYNWEPILYYHLCQALSCLPPCLTVSKSLWGQERDVPSILVSGTDTVGTLSSSTKSSKHGFGISTVNSHPNWGKAEGNQIQECFYWVPPHSAGPSPTLLYCASRFIPQENAHSREAQAWLTSGDFSLICFILICSQDIKK